MDFLKLGYLQLSSVVMKMQKKIVISIAVVTLLIGIMATSVLASEQTLKTNNAKALEVLLTTAESATPRKLVPRTITQDTITADDGSTPIISDEVEFSEVNYNDLRETVPTTYEEADDRISSQRTRFLLYTHDGKHIMWGFVGNGYFVGTDNLGKRCWGIYGKCVFAGFYDGEFFWGKYRSGNWKAEGLFRTNHSYGKYILFPTLDITPAIATTNP